MVSWPPTLGVRKVMSVTKNSPGFTDLHNTVSLVGTSIRLGTSGAEQNTHIIGQHFYGFRVRHVGGPHQRLEEVGVAVELIANFDGLDSAFYERLGDLLPDDGSNGGLLRGESHAVLEGSLALDLAGEGAGAVCESVMKAERAGGVGRRDRLGWCCRYNTERWIL